MLKAGRYMKLSNSFMPEIEQEMIEKNKEKDKFKKIGIEEKSYNIINTLYTQDNRDSYKQLLVEKLTNKYPELKPVIKNIEKRRSRIKIPSVICNVIDFPLILSALAIKLAASIVTIPACVLLNKGKNIFRKKSTSVGKQVAGGIAAGIGSVAIGGIYFPLAIAERIVLLQLEVQEKILEKIFFSDKQFVRDALKIQETLEDNELE